MKGFIGSIQGGNSTEKTITIHNSEGVSGATIGQSVIVIPIDRDHTTIRHFGYATINKDTHTWEGSWKFEF